MMDSTFVRAIQDSVLPETITINGMEYATGEVYNPPFRDEPQASALTAGTLTSIVTYWTRYIEEMNADFLIHVRSYHEVAIVSDIQGVLRKREVQLIADCGVPQFKFDYFMVHAAFMVGIQTLFLDFGDRAKVMQRIGTIRDEAVRTSNDDGVTQRVTASAGITLSQEVSLPNPVMLKPFRTFGEIDQPPSQFILRVEGGSSGKLPTVALFEADGGRWRNEAALAIRDYLAEKLTGATILA